MPKKNVHVVPHADGWAVEVEGMCDRAVYPDQMTAIAAGWKRAKHDRVELLLHDRNGEIWSRNTFDNDLPDVKR